MGYFDRNETSEGASSLGASWTSTTISVTSDRSILAQVTIAANADAVGTVSFEGSVDGANWYVIPFTDSSGTTGTTYAVTAGVNSSEPFLLGLFPHVRAKYTRTSGGAAATIRVDVATVK